MAKLKAVFLGPAATLDGVARGQEGEWDTAALEYWQAKGYQFEPADKRQNLPEADAAALDEAPKHKK